MPFDAVSMTMGHIAVALATGLVLAHADHALFVVAWMAAMVLPARTSPLPVVIPARVAAIPEARHVIGGQTSVRINAPRGPPEIS